MSASLISAAVQNVAIAALLALIVSILCRLCRIGPVARHALWLMVLIKLVTPPIVVFEVPWALPAVDPSDGGVQLTVAESLEPRELTTDGRRNATLPPSRAERPPASGLARSQNDVPRSVSVWLRKLLSIDATSCLASIWAFGALLMLAIQAARATRMARRVAIGHAPPAALLKTVDEVRTRLALGPIPVVVLPDIRSPLVWCANPLRPMLLWPAELPDQLSSSCLGGLITHEAAHIKRRDHWVGWLELAAGTIWWWNPLFWFVRTRLRENAELACDAWVIDTMPDGRRAYAEALLAACTAGPSRFAPMPAVGVSTGSRRFLERRLAMIMQDRVPVRLSRVAAASVALVALATLPVWAARMTPQTPTLIKPAATAPVTVASPKIDGSPVIVSPATVTIAPQAVELSASDFFQSAGGRLPDDAKKLIDKFDQEQADARKEMESKLAAQREELVKGLQALQDSYTKAGKLDEAVAIRDQIRRMSRNAAGTFTLKEPLAGRVAVRPKIAVGPSPARVAPVAAAPFKLTARDGRFLYGAGNVDPIAGAIQALRGQTNASLVVEVEGTDSKDAKVWGTDTYTDDSSVAAAAVHAGILKPGEKGFVRVIILPGQTSYTGSARHGIASEGFGQWDGSFKLEKASR